jgi:peptidoglycan/LPS O-acetylase OafA/YrhL
MDHRLRWLDATRGIAVLLVVLAHTADQFSRRYSDFIQIGNAGVVLFFLCSGYVIAISLDSLSFRQFWIRRFWRLYPLYWCSIVLFVALGLSDTTNPGAIMFNFTMLQSLVGLPHVSAIYWSLGVEVTFYITLSGLQLLGLHRRSAEIFLALAGCGLIMSIIFKTESPVPTALPLCAFGMIIYHYDQGHYSARQLRLYMALLVVYLLTLPAPIAFTVGWLLALFVFVALHQLQARPWPRWLVWCGVVSYSIYLLHPIPLHFTHGWAWPLIFPLATLGYTLIEAPAIQLGRRLTRPGRNSQALRTKEA